MLVPFPNIKPTNTEARLPDFQPDQVLLLTQGMLCLGASHHAVGRLLDFWVHLLAKNAEEAAAAPEGVTPKSVLSPDEIADLARLLAVVVPRHMVVFEAISMQLTDSAIARLSPSGHASLQAAFAEGTGPEFPSRERLMEQLANASPKRRSSVTLTPAPPAKRRRSSSRSPSPGDRSRSRDRSPSPAYDKAKESWHDDRDDNSEAEPVWRHFDGPGPRRDVS